MLETHLKARERAERIESLALSTLLSQSSAVHGGMLSVATCLSYGLIATTSHDHLLHVSKRGVLMGQQGHHPFSANPEALTQSQSL